MEKSMDSIRRNCSKGVHAEKSSSGAQYTGNSFSGRAALLLFGLCALLTQGCAYGGGTIGTGYGSYGAYGGGTIGTGLQYGGLQSSGIPDTASYFRINGVVTDKQGAVLEDADVEVPTSQLSETAETRSDGTFELQGIANEGSSMRISVSYEGETATCSIPAVPGSIDSAQMKLRVTGSQTLSCKGVSFKQIRK